MIAVIDYGLGNLRSVAKALETVGAKVNVTSNPKDIAKAKAILLPGVGAFHVGMRNLDKLKITHCLYKAIEAGVPFLGICLGLQLLFTESKEHGRHKGFNIIEGKVKRFSGNVKIPHMGWNQVKIQNLPNAELQRSLSSGSRRASKEVSTFGTKSKIQNTGLKIFEGVADNSYFYFVHSYHVEPEDKSIIIGTTEYGLEFASAINKGNIWGVQFHPEKSSELGLKVLENFIKNVG